MNALRCLVKTVNSLVKRKMGGAVYGKILVMAREIKFACVAHNTRPRFDSGLVRVWRVPKICYMGFWHQINDDLRLCIQLLSSYFI